MPSKILIIQAKCCKTVEVSKFLIEAFITLKKIQIIYNLTYRLLNIKTVKLR